MITAKKIFSKYYLVDVHCSVAVKLFFFLFKNLIEISKELPNLSIEEMNTSDAPTASNTVANFKLDSIHIEEESPTIANEIGEVQDGCYCK